MKRYPKKQAHRVNRSASEVAIEVFNSVYDTFGRWTYVLAILLLFSIGGGLQSFFMPSDAASEKFDQVQDNISEACWAKLIRSGLRETTVDRYERQQMESELKVADTCTQDANP